MIQIQALVRICVRKMSRKGMAAGMSFRFDLPLVDLDRRKSQRFGRIGQPVDHPERAGDRHQPRHPEVGAPAVVAHEIAAAEEDDGAPDLMRRIPDAPGTADLLRAEPKCDQPHPGRNTPALEEIVERPQGNEAAEAGAEAKEQIDDGGAEQAQAQEIARVRPVPHDAAEAFGDGIDDGRDTEHEAPLGVREMKLAGDGRRRDRQVHPHEVENRVARDRRIHHPVAPVAVAPVDLGRIMQRGGRRLGAQLGGDGREKSHGRAVSAIDPA